MIIDQQKKLRHFNIVTSTKKAKAYSLCIERKDSAEISVENEGSKKNPKKRVSFASNVMEIETLHHADYTTEERFRSWYFKADILQMRQDFNYGNKKKEIERISERKRMRKASRKAVMEEQQRIKLREKIIIHHDDGCCLLQRKNNEIILVEEAIASSYVVFSKYCAFEAYNRGLTVEIEVFTTTSNYNDYDDEKEMEVRLKSQRQFHNYHSDKQKQNSFSTKLFIDYFLACTA